MIYAKAEMWKVEMSDLKSVGIKFEKTKKSFAIEDAFFFIYNSAI